MYSQQGARRDGGIQLEGLVSFSFCGKSDRRHDVPIFYTNCGIMVICHCTLEIFLARPLDFSLDRVE